MLFGVSSGSLLSLLQQLAMPNLRGRLYAEERPICLRLLDTKLRFLPSGLRQCQMQSLLIGLLLQQHIQHLQQDRVQSCQLRDLSQLISMRDLHEGLEDRLLPHLCSHLQHRWLLELLLGFHLRGLHQGLQAGQRQGVRTRVQHQQLPQVQDPEHLRQMH